MSCGFQRLTKIRTRMEALVRHLVDKALIRHLVDKWLQSWKLGWRRARQNTLLSWTSTHCLQKSLIFSASRRLRRCSWRTAICERHFACWRPLAGPRGPTVSRREYRRSHGPSVGVVRQTIMSWGLSLMAATEAAARR